MISKRSKVDLVVWVGHGSLPDPGNITYAEGLIFYYGKFRSKISAKGHPELVAVAAYGSAAAGARHLDHSFARRLVPFAYDSVQR